MKIYRTCISAQDHVLLCWKWGLGKQGENLISSGWWFEPLWKIWKSIGMIIPKYGKNKHVPNNQPVLVLVYLPATSIDYLHQGNSITKRKTDPISRDVATTSWIARLSPYHQSHDLDGHLFFLPSVESFDVQNQKDMLGYVGMFSMIFWNMLGFFLDPYLL